MNIVRSNKGMLVGYGDYSDWFIGHSGSTYWRKKESERAEFGFLSAM
jgi:hypothetical protein